MMDSHNRISAEVRSKILVRAHHTRYWPGHSYLQIFGLAPLSRVQALSVDTQHHPGGAAGGIDAWPPLSCPPDVDCAAKRLSSHSASTNQTTAIRNASTDSQYIDCKTHKKKSDALSKNATPTLRMRSPARPRRPTDTAVLPFKSKPQGYRTQPVSPS
jgi:hypothetical protein